MEVYILTRACVKFIFCPGTFMIFFLNKYPEFSYHVCILPWMLTLVSISSISVHAFARRLFCSTAIRQGEAFTLFQTLLSFQDAGQTSTAPTALCDASVPANPSAIPTTGSACARPHGWGQPAKKVTQAGCAQAFLIKEIMYWSWSVDLVDRISTPSCQRAAQQQPPLFVSGCVRQ